ncbi:MAG TPA: acyl-CoA dehydrogenase family protein [Streptosporangiaceae bacterium]|jgi:alkylation response protein AidB-like acyl-CoA dehydrogenase
MMDLLYSDVENELRGSVRGLLEARSPWTAVLERTESAEPYDTKLWRTLAAEVGGAGLAVPEELGGAGASCRETAVVLEELGRAVAPVPFLGSAVLATAALLHAGDTELIGPLADGSRTAALAVPFSTPPGGPLPSISVSDGALTGEVLGVADALPADMLLVQADGGLYAVEAADVRRAPVTSLDMTRQLCDVSFESTPARLVASGDAAVQAALTAGAALLASEQLGLAERCLEITVDYLKTRHQFGRPVGSFQGLKHRLADLWVAITQARAVARYAAACVAADDPDAPVAVAVAQAHCSPVAVRAAEECVQMHGGIGFTWEHPAHLYLKRAKSTSIALGTADRHRAALAGLVDLPS